MTNSTTQSELPQRLREIKKRYTGKSKDGHPITYEVAANDLGWLINEIELFYLARLQPEDERVRQLLESFMGQPIPDSNDYDCDICRMDSQMCRHWQDALINRIATLVSTVATETRLEGQVEMQEMIVNALGDVKNPCDVEGVDIKSDFSGGFERARVESIQAVRALSPDPNYREKLKDGERERIANSIIALHRRIYGTTELDEYNEGLNISDVLAAIESKEQPTLSDILTELEIAEIEARHKEALSLIAGFYTAIGASLADIPRLIAAYKLLAAERDEWKYDYNVMLEQRDVAREREEESAREYNADIERLKDQVRSLQQERDRLLRGENYLAAVERRTMKTLQEIRDDIQNTSAGDTDRILDICLEIVRNLQRIERKVEDAKRRASDAMLGPARIGG